jgi:unsaturated chondroitin disaccharide hydrolase
MSNIYLVVDAIGLIRNSKSFTQTDYESLFAWMREYVSWLQTSPKGAYESASQNNLGTWYDVQLVSLLLFLDEVAIAKQIQMTITTNRIVAHIMPGLHIYITKQMGHSHWSS